MGEMTMSGIEKRIERLEEKTEDKKTASWCVEGEPGESAEDAIVRDCKERGISREVFDKGMQVVIVIDK